MKIKDTDTGRQLLAYCKASRTGQDYTGPLSDEAKNLINICGWDLTRLETQAKALHFLDTTFSG